MKKFIRNVIVMAMSIFFVGFIGTNIALAATTPSLGTASTFSALAHIFTSTTIPYGASLFGDLGYATTTGVSAYVSGTTYINNATYLQAGIDQHTALSALNSQPCTFTFNNAVDLTNDISHGPLGIYVPGVYCSLGAMSIGSGGTITLDGTGTYIFRPAGTLITSDLSSVITTNGASACDIFWTPQTPPALASTILGSDTKFVGTVIEPVGPVNSDITIGGGTHWIGRALAFDWSVKTNPIIMKYVTITVPTCPVPPPPPPPPPHIPETVTLHIIKHVVNNNGGTAIASSFILHVKGSSSMGIGDVVGSPAAGVESPGISYTLSSGNYTVNEDIFSGYTQNFTGDCDGNGNIYLNPGDEKTCMITNDDIDIPPPPYTPPAIISPPPYVPKTATLHIMKLVINGSGATAIPSDFTLHVKKSSVDVVGSPAPGASSPGTMYSLSSGTYNISENMISGYKRSFRGDCNLAGIITLSPGDNKTCIVVNTSILVLPKVPGVIIHDKIPPSVSKISPHFPNTGKPLLSKSSSVRYTSTGSNLKATKFAKNKPTTPQSVITSNKQVKFGLPIRLKIPNIHVNTSIEHVGITTQGEMGVPKGRDNVAWFNLGPRPGENGSAVIDGHYGVWKNGKITVFNNLFKLKTGDTLSIEDENGMIITFIVRELRLYDKDDNTFEVFNSNDGKAHLNLITCQGIWNKKKQSYPNRLVVFTDRI